MKLYCNKNLSENVGFHARVHDEFVLDYRHISEYPFVHYPEDYDGEEILKLSCSQHTFDKTGERVLSDYERKKITDSWTKYLSENVIPVKTVQVCTRMSQKTFDALCNQTTMESLRIKGFLGKNIDEIGRLTRLKKLYIESAPSLEQIEAIGELTNLEVLILGNTRKIKDYTPLKKLKNVRVLSICKYSDLESPITVESDEFLSEMPSLQYIDMVDVRFKRQTFLKPENVKNMEFAVFFGKI